MPSCFDCRRRVTNNYLFAKLLISSASFGVLNKLLSVDSGDILQLPDPVNAYKVVSAPVTIGAVADAKRGRAVFGLKMPPLAAIYLRYVHRN